MAKQLKNEEKVLHIRLENNYYKKLEKEAKKYKRSLPNMVKYFLENYLEKNKETDFTDKELYKMQSSGGIYSDLKDDDIYDKVEVKPVQWD